MTRRRDHLRPVELLAIAGGCGAFAGAITLLTLRAPLLAAEIAVGVFVVALVALAMFDLAISPRLDADDEGRHPDAETARVADRPATGPDEAGEPGESDPPRA